MAALERCAVTQIRPALRRSWALDSELEPQPPISSALHARAVAADVFAARRRLIA
jgi:hypothetical protein